LIVNKSNKTKFAMKVIDKDKLKSKIIVNLSIILRIKFSKIC